MNLDASIVQGKIISFFVHLQNSVLYDIYIVGQLNLTSSELITDYFYLSLLADSVYATTVSRCSIKSKVFTRNIEIIVGPLATNCDFCLISDIVARS